MKLVLHANPMSPPCQKALMALYETGVRFTLNMVDLSTVASRASIVALWPIGTPPILEDKARKVVLPDASSIIEYVDLFYADGIRLVPLNPAQACAARLRDRFFDNNLQAPIQKILSDRLRPPGRSDPYGVTRATEQLRTALGIIERQAANSTWATGETFSIADCAAAAALWYTNIVIPFSRSHPNTAAYLNRLQSRPSFTRVMKEAAHANDPIPA